MRTEDLVEDLAVAALAVKTWRHLANCAYALKLCCQMKAYLFAHYDMYTLTHTLPDTRRQCAAQCRLSMLHILTLLHMYRNLKRNGSTASTS